jgi:hypothetical protein
MSEKTYELPLNFGAGIGLLAGGVIGTIATIKGGYEIGSAVNDALEISNIWGRATLDLTVMTLAAPFAIGAGLIGGYISGGLSEILYKRLRGD